VSFSFEEILASAFANNGLFDFELGIFQKKKM